MSARAYTWIALLFHAPTTGFSNFPMRRIYHWRSSLSMSGLSHTTQTKWDANLRKIASHSGSYLLDGRRRPSIRCASSSLTSNKNPFNGTESIHSARRARENAQDEDDFRLLPLFPLHDEIVFPDGRVSLRLFEERYLKLFATILYGEDEIDPEMADELSPYLATNRFGIVWRTPSPLPGVPGSLASTGVAMKVVSHEWIGLDGSREQLIVNARGYKRFKVKEVIRQDPVVEARVTVDKEMRLTSDRLEKERSLSVRHWQKVCDAVRKLSAEKAMRKAYFSMEERMRVLNKLTLNETAMLELTGEELSYWVAVNMFDSLVDQQEMLQLPTPRRLRYQMQLLSDTKDELIEEAAAFLNGTSADGSGSKTRK